MSRPIVALLAACWGLALLGPAHSTTLLNSQGFEAPAFGAGALNGQNGWQFVRSGAPTTTATVQSQASPYGSQALRIDRAAQSNGYGLDLLGTGPSGRYVQIDWDMRVNTPNVNNPGFGPFFGVQVFDETTSGFKQLAGFGIDAGRGGSTADLIYQPGGFGSSIDGQLAPLETAPLDVWRHYRIELDFQEDSYSVFVNDQFRIKTGFVDKVLGIDGFTDADLVGISVGPAGSADDLSVGTAFFDNFLIRDGLRGDYNDDGVVDAADYTLWRTQHTMTGSGLAADGDADGQVTANDYLIWARSYGMTNALSGGAMATPEPASAALSLLALAAAAGRGRRAA